MNTKKYILLLFLFSALVTFAQTDDSNDHLKKIKSFKVAYFTQELSLSTDEAAEFWPIYNKFEQAQIEMWTQMRQRSQGKEDLSALTQNEALTRLNLFIEDKTSEHERTMKLYKELLQALPANKVLMLPRAEEDFRRKLMRMYRDRRKSENQSDSNRKEKDIPLL